MFTHRFKFSLETNRWARSLKSAREEGRELADLAISNPTAAGFCWDADVLARALGVPEIARYSPVSRGSEIARDAVAKFYTETHGADVSAKNVHLTASTSEAYSWLLKLLCDPGDNVAIPTPSYPLIEFLCDMEAVETRAYALSFSESAHRWELDFESLESAVNARTRAVFCVNPNNPTGSVFSAAERARLIAFARERNLPLVVDEVFLEYAGANASEAPQTFAGTRDAPVFVLGGLSKTAALPQIKAGWILTCGTPHFCADATARLDFVADTFLSVGTPAQCAIPQLLREAPEIRKRICARLDANEAALRKWCAESPHALSPLAREAGWYGIVRLPRGVDEESLVLDLLRRENVLVHPGYFYDVENVPAPHLVFSLLASEADFLAAFPKIDAALRRN